MIDDALRTHRMFGMIQPDGESERAAPPLFKVGCVGRITQFAESGDGQYIVTLTGISRFAMIEEVATMTPYRQGRVDFQAFAGDFQPRAGEEHVDRDGVLKALRGLRRGEQPADRLGFDQPGAERGAGQTRWR